MKATLRKKDQRHEETDDGCEQISLDITTRSYFTARQSPDKLTRPRYMTDKDANLAEKVFFDYQQSFEAL